MMERGKWGLLTGLVVVWAALIVFRLMNEPEPQRAPLTFRSGQMAAPESARGGSGLPTVIRPVPSKLEQVSFKAPKNIFAPLASRLEGDDARKARLRVAKKRQGALIVGRQEQGPTAPPPTPEELARQQQELAAQQLRQQQELALQQARQQMAQYRFLGYLTEGGQQRAFLGKGREIYIVRAGETLDGRIQVMAIEASAIKMRDATTSVETTIPLAKGAGGPF
jgi:hypothetical protein